MSATLPEVDLPGIRLSHTGLSVDNGGSAPIFVHQALAQTRLPNGWKPSDFAVLFSAILTDLDHYDWLFDSSETFQWPFDDEAVSQRIESLLSASRRNRHDDYYVAAPGFLAELAPYIRDDWNVLFGFARPPADVQELIRLRNLNENGRQFLEQVDVMFDNWDGCFWSLYTRHPELIEKVKRSLAGNTRVTIKDSSLVETARELG